MKVLITGGAGFIGSTVASACLDAGLVPVVLDDLSTGRREFTAGRHSYEGTITDAARRYVTQLGVQFGGPEQVTADLETLARQEAKRVDAPELCEVFLGASVIRP